MGAALSSGLNLTSARAASGAKIEYSGHNRVLLESILQFVQDIVTTNPDEAEVIFKQPFIWFTNLTAKEFEGNGYCLSENSAVSEALCDDGVPLLSIELVSDKFQMKVKSFKQFKNVLSVASDKKLEEVRQVLQANQDPVAVIMGQAFANVESSDNALLQAHKMMAKSTDNQTDEQKNIEKRFPLLLMINKLELKLLHSIAERVSKDAKLSPAVVENEFDALQEFCGYAPHHCLKNLVWASEYKFNTGCRAPPWRQANGDIAYIEVKTEEGEEISITACNDGYFQNGGRQGNGELNYEQHGELFKSLSELLKKKSNTFLTFISAKEFTCNSEPDEQCSLKNGENGTNAPTTNGQETEASAVAADKERPTTKDTVKSVGKTTKGKAKHAQANSRLTPTTDLVQNLDSCRITSLNDKNDNTNQKSKKKKPMKLKSRPNHRKNNPSCHDNKAMSDSSSESEEEEENQERRQESNADLPSEYWQIQKLVKYLKSGFQTATVIALCALRDFQLTEETCQFAIRDVGGLETLINLLETKDVKCKIGALKILKEISLNLQIRKAIADLGGLQTMVKILVSPDKQLHCLAAETIAHVAKFKRARRTVRQHGGIKKLVSLLDCGSVSMASEIDINVARAGALALWSCSRSTKNKAAIRKAGGIPLLAKLLKSTNESMLTPVVGTLQECASEPNYRLAIRTEGMIEDLVRNLKSEDHELQRHCASAIFKCAEDLETRTLVRDYCGLDPLVALLANVENKELLASVTGAIWKCAISNENVIRFQELKAIEQLVTLLNEQPEEVLINVVGALGECAKIPANRQVIRKAGGISPMVKLLTGTNQQLLVNVTRAVGECAAEAENMAIIDRLDGVRLLWSLLKSINPQVQASAAWAICPCIENAKDAGEMVRSFVGGLELIVGLLKSDDTEVLASVCAAISKIAIDEENLAVITDHGVVVLLAKLTDTADDKLRHHLAEAIARCCTWGNNRVSFGKANAVAPLVRYLRSNNNDVHRSTAKALHHLSFDANNCIAMHGSGVVQPLLDMVGSSDEILQSAAAGCLSNIRRLALANEKAKYDK